MALIVSPSVYTYYTEIKKWFELQYKLVLLLTAYHWSGFYNINTEFVKDNLDVCMYVCMHVCDMYDSMCACMCIYVCDMYVIRMYVCVYVSMCVGGNDCCV